MTIDEATAENGDAKIKQIIRKMLSIMQNKPHLRYRVEKLIILKKHLLHHPTRDHYMVCLTKFKVKDGETKEDDDVFW